MGNAIFLDKTDMPALLNLTKLSTFDLLIVFTIHEALLAFQENISEIVVKMTTGKFIYVAVELCVIIHFIHHHSHHCGKH